MMTETFDDKFFDLPAKIDKGETFYEAEIKITGNRYVWLDVAAHEELQLFVSANDYARGFSRPLINHAIIPRGSFLSLFNNKLISNKTLTIRTSKKATVYYESKSAI